MSVSGLKISREFMYLSDWTSAFTRSKFSFTQNSGNSVGDTRFFCYHEYSRVVRDPIFPIYIYIYIYILD